MRRTQWSEEWGKRRTPNVGRGKSPFPKGRIIRMSKTQGKCQSANLADVGALPWLILMRLPCYYNKGDLPKDQYLLNTLENQIKIPTYHHEQFLAVFKANCKYLNIENGLGKASASSGDGTTKAVDISHVLGQPQGEFDKTAFVIMPFSEKGISEKV